MTNALGEIGSADYVMLTTYRKDGTPVGTPVWAVAEDGKLYVWTVTDSWKVKRLRRNPAVTVQVCDARGKKLSGPVLPGTGRVLDAAGTEHVRALLKRKYKLLATVALLGSTLRRGKAGTIGLEITPAE
ncbi:PPOX class F420-dependent oxidoreductase [Nocardia farcinica]|uniref:PPOX class probable F420-dependent enzyme, Rv2061 family n=1 Tax=Nocardia farcinica TaxID=37329 RepID=A0A0H5NHY1_NOCFR|nr:MULTISPECIES: PPOX class F420-dependent oxidoreductase [Nocardia]AXK84450.1 PPOX class F420-dependent oxidoreductase [Nocardia farcinica]MBA4856412.1 PPOX class F420-dependent oxidoreductase [Nocardia farcinica]MBC9814238.1 PPOX class F420-dependent oxidoreductase [Nocardia farcinica]MBF6069726.1 PPOX class F420-dependent oxidoreductase [Nocardia farcinica]MBF6139233.1 PPOX class F420-dependent oxidoreductase [Nocardia farcinica]